MLKRLIDFSGATAVDVVKPRIHVMAKVAHVVSKIA